MHPARAATVAALADVDAAGREKAGREKPAASAPKKNLPLAITSLALMVSASYAANDLLRFDSASEPLQLGLYGFLVFNMTGATGCLFSAILPGRFPFVHRSMRELSYTLGSVLLFLGLQSIVDMTGFWTDHEMSVARFVLLGVGFLHLLVKNFYNRWLELYIQCVAHITATSLLVLGIKLGSTSVAVAAALQIVAALLQSKHVVPRQLLLTEEMGLALMALSCHLMHAPFKRQYALLLMEGL